MFFGVNFYSFIVGNVANLISNIAGKEQALINRLNSLSNYCQRNQIPNST